MRQEQIKEILERIRSNKNKGTNELVATEEVATLNATNEATLSVASARGITTTTISVDNYLYLESYDENGNAFEEPIIGNYSGTLYTLFGSVNMSSLLAANNLSVSDLTACYLTLYGDGGDFSWAYSIYDINGNFIGYNYGGGMQVYVPLKDVYDSSGNWSFVLEPVAGYDCLYMSGAGDLEVSYNQTPTIEVNRNVNLQANDYITLISADEMGNMAPGLYLGDYNNVIYGIAVSVNMNALLSANNISMEDVNDYVLTLSTVSGSMYGWYEIIDGNGTSVMTGECGGNSANIPLKDIYDACGSWNFIIVPCSYQTAVEISTSVNVGVSYTEELEITGIEISSPPTKTNYIEGDMLDLTGMIVKAICADGTKVAVTDYTVSPTGALKSTNTAFTVSYESYSVKQTINVYKMESLSIQGNLSKTGYKIGEAIDLTGIQVYANFEDGSTRQITDFSVYPAVCWKTGDNIPITISYTQGTVTKTASMTVSVFEDEKRGSKINQTELNYSCGAGEASINLFTERLLFERQDVSIGINSYQIGVSHVYNSAFDENVDLRYGDRENFYFKTYMGKGFKLNVQQYVFAVDDHYVYVDGGGYRHTFVALGDNLSYYDTSGLGLMLTVENNEKVLRDEAGNKMYFDAVGRLVKTVSCHNDAIVKKFIYNTKGQLTLVYDDRTVSNQIKLTYDSETNLLKTMECGYVSSSSGEKTVSYSYDNGWLKMIWDGQDGTDFVYDSANAIMQVAVSKPDNYALKFENVDGKVCGVIQGAYDVDSASMTENNIQRRNYYITIENGKGVTVRDQKGATANSAKDLNVNYYFNAKGFTTAILEAHEGDSNDLRTMKKMPGVSIAFPSNVDIYDSKINTQLVYGYPCSYGYIMDISDSVIDYRRNKYAGYQYYNLTFFLWLNQRLADPTVTVKVTSGGKVDESRVYVDNTAIGVWQYVTVPIKITNDTIEEIYVRFSKDDIYASGKYCKMSNMRLTYATRSDYYVKAAQESAWAPMNSATLIRYKAVNGAEENKTVNADCYMSGKDLQSTFMSMYKNRAMATSGNYALSLCDGTKKIWVESASIYAANAKDNANVYQYFPLAFDTTESTEYGLALYNHETISPDGSTSTYRYVRFYPNVTLGTYSGPAIMQLTVSIRTINNEVKRAESYVYMDLQGRVLQECDEYGVTVKYEYHTDGILKKQTVTSGNESMVVYENAQSTSADGKYDILTDKYFNLGEKYYYKNLIGNLDKVENVCYNETTETLYNTTNYGYDTYYEKLLSVSSTADNQTYTNTMTYASGELSTVTDGKVKYGFTKNESENSATFGVYENEACVTLEKVTQNNTANTVTHKYYREDGMVTDTFVYTMNDYGKPVSIKYDNVEKVTYNYTEGTESQAVWLLESVEDDFCGRTYAYTYNADGSQKSVSFAGFKVTKLNESETEYEIGTSNPTKLKQTVTKGARICEIANSVNGAPAPFLDRSYEYDGFGRTKTKRIKDPTNVQEDTDTAISKTELGYSNAHMLPTSETYSRNNNTVYTATYAYDGRGNIQSITDSHGTRTYTYDALNRLTKEATTGSTILTNGNKLYVYDSNGRMTSFNGQAMTYDNRGRLTKIGDTNLTYDNYGNRLTKGNFVYTWTRGRLLASVNSTTYTYDKNGVRTRKVVVDGDNTITHEYFYDGDKLIAEKVGDKYFYFFYDESGVCGFRYENIDYEYVKNIFGDVIGIYNEYGTHVATYAYDAWGNMTYCNAGTDVAYINPFLYRGYYYDSESGLYYLMSRYYDPSVGQFILPDTLDYLAPEIIGGVDLYAYCGYNPVMYYDPTGHLAITTILAIAGGIIGGLIGGIYGYSQIVNDPNVATGWKVAYIITMTLLGAVAGAFIGWELGAMLMATGIGTATGGSAMAGSTLFATQTITSGGAVAVGGVVAQDAALISVIGAIGIGLMFAQWEPGTWPGDDPTQPPGDDFIWRGPGEVGSEFGEWYNPTTGDQLHPNLKHPLPKGPHWGWRNKLLRILIDIFK